MRRACFPVIALVAACAGDGARVEDAAPPRVELGAGTSSFVPLVEDGTIELVAGPQGGWHLDLTTRFWGFDPEGLVLSYEVVREGDLAPMSFPTAYTLTADRVLVEGDHFLRLGNRAVLDVGGPAEVVGQRVRVSVTALATSGAGATDARDVTIVDEDP